MSKISVFITIIFILAGQTGNCAFGKKPAKPEFPYQSTLTHKSPEKNLPICATKRILKERENFLGLTYCNYPIEKNTIRPYRGEIKANGSGHVLIVLGYHYLEKPWGGYFKTNFKNIFPILKTE